VAPVSGEAGVLLFGAATCGDESPCPRDPSLASLHGMNPTPGSPKQGPGIILAIAFGVIVLLVCIFAIVKLS